MSPLHRQPRLILLVFAGGAVGTGIREALSLTWPAAPHGFPTTVFAINLVGSFALGALLESLARRGSDDGGRRILRLLFGTGVLGGFTTYSALATDVATRLGSATGVALTYAALSLLAGVAAAALGIALAGAVQSRSTHHVTGDDEEDAG
ncbi:CrcB family protein [Frondihabitans sp. 4ASC-45]|uniref:fluoride efflux transporter FluC n=1 Tax=Frondihabitans sp. 4ASC-45 TaxID=3111636 RepID=UPI003C1E5A9D